MSKRLKILMAGEGGQGVQAAAEILAEAAYGEGLEALYIPNFGVEQRGGISMAYLQLASQGEVIGAPKFERADVLVALSVRAIARTRHYAGEDTLYIYDNSLIEPAQVNDRIIGLQYYEATPPCPAEEEGQPESARLSGENRSCLYFRPKETAAEIPQQVKAVAAIPANDIAKRELNPRVFNIMILGAVLGATEILPQAALEKALISRLGDKFAKYPELKTANLQALTRGYELLAGLGAKKHYGRS